MTEKTNLSYAVQHLRCYMVPDKKGLSKKGQVELDKLRELILSIRASRTAASLATLEAIPPQSSTAPAVNQTEVEDRVFNEASESLFDQIIDVEGMDDDEEEPEDDEEGTDDDEEEALTPPKGTIGERVFEIGRPYEGYCIIFDCETTTDTDQELRFGAYQVRGIPQQTRMELAEEGEMTPERIEELRVQYDALEEWGLFYNPDLVKREELEAHLPIVSHADTSKKPQLLTKDEFIEEVLYQYAREADKVADTLLVIGHNLPFDLSRLAKSWTTARGKFYGGFRLKLCKCKNEGKKDCAFHPPIRIRKLGRGKYKYGVCKTRKPIRVSGQLVKSEESNTHEIRFLDTVTLAGALLGPGDKRLEALSKKLNTPHIKQKVDYHGKPITLEYIEYCLNDVQCTWEVYAKLRAIYRQHNLGRPMWYLFSEASLGKAYLDAFGFPKFLLKDKSCRHPEITPVIIGKFMSTYFGGRSEIRIRHAPQEVIHTDFRSQYTTVNALMKLQDLLLAERISVKRDDPEALRFLENATVADMQKRDNWEKLRGIALVVPQNDIFPLRTVYAPHGGTNIGVNCVTSRLPVWVTFADCLASKFLSGGKLPKILETIELAAASEARKPTNGVRFFGDPDYEINLKDQDLFQRIIEMRIDVEALLDSGEAGDRAAYLESLSGALKATASSTSYGVLVEINTERRSKPSGATIYDAHGGHRKSVQKVEKPGTYFAGPIGTFIPAAGRLLLAIAEAKAAEKGISYLFCDTDSMCFARPDHMDRETFRREVKEIADWFTVLSPYFDRDGRQLDILRFEKVNYRNGKRSDGMEPLYGVAISAKRYVLYNRASEPLEGARQLRNSEGDYWIRLRKVSAHGTGDVAQPSEVDDADEQEDAESPDDCVLVQPSGYSSIVRYLDGDNKETTQKNKLRIVANAKAADLLIDLAQRFVESMEGGGPLNFSELALDTPHFWQVALASSHTWETYGEPLGCRPFSFFTFIPAPGGQYKGRQALDEAMLEAIEEELRTSYYAPFTRDFANINDQIRRFDTNEPARYVGKLDGVDFSTLYERLRFYFDRDEYKSFQREGKPELLRRNLIVIAQRFQGKETGGILDDDHLDTDGAIRTDADTCYTEGALDHQVLKNFVLSEVSEESGILLRTLQRYSSGDSAPRPPEADAIARALTVIVGQKQRERPQKPKGPNKDHRSDARDRALQNQLREQARFVVALGLYTDFVNAYEPETYKKALAKLQQGKPPFDERAGYVARLVRLSGLSRDTIKNFLFKDVSLAEKDRQALTRAVNLAQKQDWPITLAMAEPGAPLTFKEVKRGVDLRDLYGGPEHFPKLISLEEAFRRCEEATKVAAGLDGNEDSSLADD